MRKIDIYLGSDIAVFGGEGDTAESYTIDLLGHGGCYVRFVCGGMEFYNFAGVVDEPAVVFDGGDVAIIVVPGLNCGLTGFLDGSDVTIARHIR